MQNFIGFNFIYTIYQSSFFTASSYSPQCSIIDTSTIFSSVQFSSLNCVRLFATPWITAHQASLSITNSRSSLKLMSIESLMPSSHLILCRPLLLLPAIFPSIRVFSSESVLHIRWPKYWSFSFSISSSNEYSGVISFWIDGFDLLSVKGLSGVFFSTQPSLWPNSHICIWLLETP